MINISYITKVRYSETDKLGIVYYSNYLIYFELGRVEFFNKALMEYSEFEKRYNLCMPITECYIKIMKPAYFADELKIITSIDRLRTRIFKFNYQIYRKNDLIVIGNSINPILNINSNKISSLPKDVLENFKLQ